MNDTFTNEQDRGLRPCVVAVDARTLTQTGKGVPRFLSETLRELAKSPALRLVLITHRQLHPDNDLPVETIVDHRWRKVPGTIWAMARLNSLANRAGADVLWGPAHLLPLRSKRLRTVLTVHDLVYRIMPQSMSRWNRLVSRRLVDASIRRADRIAAVSRSTKSDVVSMVGLDEDRVEVIYPGVATGTSEEQLADRATSSNADNYLFVLGSIEPRKNIDGLLDCVELLANRNPTVSVRITGAHHWGSSRTLDRIGDMAACKVLGFISDDDIRRQMAGARAFVMPSHYEGFGLPVIEAVGRAPIVAADIPVFRELAAYIDGIHLVDFTDPVAAAAVLDNILAANPPPARFVDGAERLFNWATTAQRYQRILMADLTDRQ